MFEIIQFYILVVNFQTKCIRKKGENDQNTFDLRSVGGGRAHGNLTGNLTGKPIPFIGMDCPLL